MPAKIVRLNPDDPQEKVYKEAALVVKKGGLVIIPTETVYGIAADSSNQQAVERLRKIKNRPQDKHFSLHIDAKEKVEHYAQDILPAAYKLMDAFWPGPLTIVLKAKGGQDTIGIRLPDNPIACSIIALAQVPVICPSANISQDKPPTEFNEALKALAQGVDMAIDAGPTRLKLESTVVDATQKNVQVLREGAIRKKDILEVANKKNLLFVCTGNSCRSVMAMGLMQKKLRDLGRTDIEVSSAGVMMLDGISASHETQVLLEKEGVDVSKHRSHRMNADTVHKSDLILVMEDVHEQRILQVYPEAKNKVFLLKEFARSADKNLNIADPVGRDEHFYQNTFNIIKEAIDRISEVI